MRGKAVPLDLTALAAHAEVAEALLKAMGNRNRLMVLCTLHDGELSVGELNARIPLSQSALSQHLATLRRAGLVATRRESQTIYYRLGDAAASAVIATLHGLFCQAPASAAVK
ncbi:MAG: ArsR/SmtB family transcription factor [Porticoccaceae bacterium]